MWRQKEWEVIRVRDLEVPGIGSWNVVDVYEAGADAMFESLIEWAEEYCPHNTVDTLKRQCYKCWEPLLKERTKRSLINP